MQKFSQEDLDDLIIRYLNGETSSSEVTFIQNWVSEDHSNKEYFDQLRKIHFLGNISGEPSGFDPRKSLERIKRKYYEYKYHEIKGDSARVIRFSPRKLAISVAAVFIFALGIGFLLQNLLNTKSGNSTAVAFNEIVAPLGARSNVTLPDGTKVWLNAGSRIRYAMNFLKNEREINLSGEAYFEVAKVKGSRFIVHTGQLDIKVWGTKFNVKAYPEEKTIQTTLVEGSVSIVKTGSKTRKAETFLVPNQTAVFYKNKSSDNNAKIEKLTKPEPGNILPLEVKKEVNTILYTSWKDSKWVIEGQTLGEFAEELERRYNVEINFEDETLMNYKFNGILANETLEQILEIVKISAPVDYEVIANQVTLKGNKTSKNIYERFLKQKN
ncbi:MAG: FecR family protein [Bacteroidales bacterium]|nr:FecR family protein [Bacteroidales bacterium]